MPFDIEKLQKERKKLKLSYDELAKITGFSRSTITNIFCGYVEFPRAETIQAIEKALRLAPQWTEEEQAQGVGNHAIVLSQKEKERLNLLMDSDDVLGEEFTNAYLKGLQIIIQQTKTK